MTEPLKSNSTHLSDNDGSSDQQIHRSPLLIVFASALYTGYSPIAPGTLASLLALAIYFLPSFEKPLILIPIVLMTIVVGAFVASKLEKVHGHDPSIVTIDEVIGMWVSLAFLPKTLTIALVAFVIFRMMDILKPWPARWIDQKPGGWAIIADDIIAGVYANLIMHISLLFFQ